MQMLRLSLVGLFLLGAAQTLAACGGDVTNNGQGGSGAGGAGGSGGAGAGGSTGDPKLACMDYCHITEVNNCPVMGDCNTFCDEVFAEVPSECEDELGALLACYIPSAKDCPDDPPSECSDEEEAAQMCQMANGCVEDECSVGSGPDGASSCGCSATCKGVPYSTSCDTPAGGAMTTCTCTQGNMVVGTCTNTDAETCGVKTSCCAQFFNL